MDDDAKAMEALKLVSDWAKWLITIETGAIAIIGTLFTSNKVVIADPARIFGTAAIVCFLISIVLSAMLLLTLPEIAQFIGQDTNIWMARDSVAGRLLGMNTQGFALMESLFFGVGLVFSSALIIAVIWSPVKP